MADFTPTQGRYLSFIHAYIRLYGYPPAESEIGAALCVSPPSVNQMVKMLEKRGLILRHPGQARSLELLVPEDEIPPWNSRKRATPPVLLAKSPSRVPAGPAAPPANLYVVSVFLISGPISEKFANKRILRVIEIRGDQTLEQLHQSIFEAYDRQDQQPYEFQLGKRTFDPDGPNYRGPTSQSRGKGVGDASKTKLDDLNLKPERVFGYWFDFDNNWYHHVQIDRIEKSIPTVTYPRLIKRVGKSPPQHGEE
jgi:Plasmid pRiA4b ORF-3-like protein/LexA DNA binding domain